MRNLKPVVHDDDIPHHDEIEVERAGRAPMWTCPAAGLLDRQQPCHQRRGLCGALPYRHAVEKPRLRLDILGFGLHQGRYPQVRQQCPKARNGVGEMRVPVTLIAAEGDGRQMERDYDFCFSLQSIQTRVHGIALSRADAISSPQSRQMP